MGLLPPHPSSCRVHSCYPSPKHPFSFQRLRLGQRPKRTFHLSEVESEVRFCFIFSEPLPQSDFPWPEPLRTQLFSRVSMFAFGSEPSSDTQLSRVAGRSGTAPPSPRGKTGRAPLYILRGLQNGKRQSKKRRTAYSLVQTKLEASSVLPTPCISGPAGTGAGGVERSTLPSVK